MKVQHGVIAGVAMTLVLMIAHSAAAESLDELIARLSKENGEAYLRPLTDGLGVGINSGINNSGSTHGILGFDIGIKVMAATVPEEANTFTPILPDGYETVPPGRTTATATGGTGSRITGAGLDSLGEPLPDGLGLEHVPAAIPQISVGMAFGTDVILRFLPKVKTDEKIGDLWFFGLGLKHDVGQYLPVTSVDIAAYAMYQKLEVGSLLDSKNFAYGVVASKSLPLLSLYGGFQLESATADVSYTLEADSPDNPAGIDVPIDLEFDSEAWSRATIGARINMLPVIYVQAEASKVFGTDLVGTVFGGGIGLKIR